MFTIGDNKLPLLGCTATYLERQNRIIFEPFCQSTHGVRRLVWVLEAIVI